MKRKLEVWRNLTDAIKGKKQDYTSISTGKAIFLLSIPMVLEMIMESVFTVVDIYFVSKLSANAVAAVGLTESIMALVYAVGIGLSMAATAVISRRIGEKKDEEASKSAVQSVILSLGIAAVISTIGILFSKDMLRIMGATKEVIESGYLYTLTMLAGNFILLLLFVLNAVFRSAGDAAISMRVIFVANLINIVLDPCLIFGLGPFPEMGIFGAALATNIGRGIAVLFQIYLLFRGVGKVKIKLAYFKLEKETLRKLFNISIGGIKQRIIATSSWIIQMRIVSVFGADAVAGYTIAIRLLLFSILPAFGISNAAATLVGQNLGANQVEKAEESVWKTAYVTMFYLGVIALLYFVYAESLIRIFIPKQEVIEIGANALRLMSIAFLFISISIVFIQAFNGAGDTRTPTRINIICYWGIETPLAFVLAILAGVGETGVFIAIVASELVMAIISYILFKRGRWKTLKI